MGKSQTAQLFAAEGVPFYDADAAVHALYGVGGAAVAPIGALFPEAVVNGGVVRPRLAAAVLGSPQKLQALEAIVHPLVAASRNEFLRAAAAQGAPCVVLDIPLLLETTSASSRKSSKSVDCVVVVSAPAAVQEARVLARPDMTAEKFAQIKARQMPDEEKRRHADFIVDSGVSVADAHAQVRAILAALKNKKGSAYKGAYKEQDGRV